MIKRLLPFDKMYCIHLASEKEREAKLIETLKYSGLLSEMEIRYTVKRHFLDKPAQEMPSIRNILYDQKLDENPSVYGNVLNCFIEHYTTIGQAYERGMKNIFIMEDDCEFIVPPHKIQEIFDHLPSDYDMVRFFYFNGDIYDQGVNLDGFRDWIGPAYNKDTYFFDISGKVSVSTLCYAMSREGMRKYLDFIDRENVARIADAQEFVMDAGMKIYGLNLADHQMVITGSQPSTIA